MVLEIYRITLLSNYLGLSIVMDIVLEIYRITLLSNKIIRLKRKEHSFRDLQNYTTLKLICGIKVTFDSFRDLQNYTTLKRNV